MNTQALRTRVKQSVMAMLRGGCLFLVLLITGALAQMGNVTDLNFVLMVSGRDGAGAVEQNTAGAVPAVQMAMEQIDAAMILPGYRLRYTTILDTTVSCGSNYLTRWHDGISLNCRGLAHVVIVVLSLLLQFLMWKRVVVVTNYLVSFKGLSTSA